MDGDNYGELVVYELSAQELPPGPGIAAASISARRGRVGAAQPPGDRWVRGAVRQPAAGARSTTRCCTCSRSTSWAEGRDAAPAPAGHRGLRRRGGDRGDPQRRRSRRCSARPRSPRSNRARPPRRGRHRTGNRHRARRTAPTRHGRRAGGPAARPRPTTLFAEADAALTDGDLGIYEDRVQEARDWSSRPSSSCGADGSGPAHDDHDDDRRLVAARPLTREVGGGAQGPVWCRSHNDAGWSSLVARRAHNPKVVGSNPTPATN